LRKAFTILQIDLLLTVGRNVAKHISLPMPLSGSSEQLIPLSGFISVLKTFIITIVSNLQAICLVSVALEPHEIEPCAVPVMLQLPGMLHCKAIVLNM
jgi:hypothetical protein